jgi:5-oxopent-3-ene-1,2,5-tricarboxylate decarboxylase / 2-hydroxyhepta-2,4-diene-1,7-dioate isomerase
MRTARVSIPGMAGIVEASVLDDGRRLLIGSRSVPAAGVRFEPASDGLVYGVILNDEDSLQMLGTALDQAPYKGPPRAPVLYIKPYNTHVGHGTTVHLPPAADRVDVCGALGIVFGAEATRVAEARALDAVRGFTVVADLSLPHTSLYRPPIREKCFDGSCPIGPWVVSREQVGDPDALEVLVHINAALQQRRSLRGLVRSIPRLIADVTEFLTLYPGDVLLAGVPVAPPSAVAGDELSVEIPGVGRLETKIAGTAAVTRS